MVRVVIIFSYLAIFHRHAEDCLLGPSGPSSPARKGALRARCTFVVPSHERSSQCSRNYRSNWGWQVGDRRADCHDRWTQERGGRNYLSRLCAGVCWFRQRLCGCGLTVGRNVRCIEVLKSGRRNRLGTSKLPSDTISWMFAHSKLSFMLVTLLSSQRRPLMM